MVTYPLPYLMWGGILMFVLKLGARRQINALLRNDNVVSHLNVLAGTSQEQVAHGDTLENLLEEVPHEKISHIRTEMIRTLIRSRIFDNHRLLGEYYLIAVDGSGIRYYRKRHCEHCLTKTSKKTGVTTYYHSVLEVKLVTDNGLALSIDTEFIENATKDMDKQDCELRAFYRLAPRLKKMFPQLPICLLMDSLHGVEQVMQVCADYGWKYIINFKHGRMPAKYEEFISLCDSVQKSNRFSFTLPDKTKQEYKFATGIEHGKQKFNAIHCTEYKPKETKQYAYMTNISVNSNRCAEIVNQGGRIRWKIENQGFNTQKNGGYELEHAYSENENATKCFYYLLQIAHILNQLMEKGSLLNKKAMIKMGSMKNIARFLLEGFRNNQITKEIFESLFAKPFQIRFSSA